MVARVQLVNVQSVLAVVKGTDTLAWQVREHCEQARWCARDEFLDVPIQS